VPLQHVPHVPRVPRVSAREARQGGLARSPRGRATCARPGSSPFRPEEDVSDPSSKEEFLIWHVFSQNFLQPPERVGFSPRHRRLKPHIKGTGLCATSAQTLDICTQDAYLRGASKTTRGGSCTFTARKPRARRRPVFTSSQAFFTTRKEALMSTSSQAFFTTRQVATALGITSQAIGWHIARGHLPATRTERGAWRITPAALEAFRARKAPASLKAAS
jgi:hypothetical protein